MNETESEWFRKSFADIKLQLHYQTIQIEKANKELESIRQAVVKEPVDNNTRLEGRDKPSSIF